MEEDKSWKDYVFEQPIDGKRTYKYEKDYNHDVSYENERKHDKQIRLKEIQRTRRKVQTYVNLGKV